MEENFHTKSYICPPCCVFWLWMSTKGVLQWTAACRAILKSSTCSSLLLCKTAGSPHSVLLHHRVRLTSQLIHFLSFYHWFSFYATMQANFICLTCICGPQKLLFFFFPAVKKQHQCKMGAEFLWLFVRWFLTHLIIWWTRVKEMWRCLKGLRYVYY